MNSQGLVSTDKQNKTLGHHRHDYNTFADSLSYRKAMLLRFADYTPSFEMEGVPTDSIELNSSDKIDSLSLKAPFKGQIRKIKESFSVPYMAILPRNWDLIYTQPSNGQDVPLDANSIIRFFPPIVTTYWRNFYQKVVSSSEISTDQNFLNENAFITRMVQALVCGEYFFSKGSLLKCCGYSGDALFHLTFTGDLAGNKSKGYDDFFDDNISKIFSTAVWFNVVFPSSTSMAGVQYRSLRVRGLSEDSSNYDVDVEFREFLDLARENPMFYVTGIFWDEFHLNTWRQAIFERYSDASDNVDSWFVLPSTLSVPEGSYPDDSLYQSQQTLNYSRLAAYQLTCAHFYSNSSVDPIYTAEQYRQYVRYFWDKIFVSVHDSFSLNGFTRKYDDLSGHLVTAFFMKSDTYDSSTISYVFDPTYTQLKDISATDNKVVLRLCAFAALFCYRKALRFGDYFVGSRPRPLAPINTDVSITEDNSVSVIDITRNIQAQRFANAVMRSRSKIEEYVKSLFGKSPAPDYHNPFYLTRQVESVFGDDVQNTGEAQQVDAVSRTSLFANQAGRFTFAFHNDDAHPCIYLQIISFDLGRYYTRATDRQFFEADRFDMFNPDFQFVGDQEVFGAELGYYDRSQDHEQLAPYYMVNTFGYQGRDMQYKQRVDRVCGDLGFALPGWFFTDEILNQKMNLRIGPDFIRSRNAELDRFFLSLTGYSLGHYFHFVCVTVNHVTAKRPMAIDPQILG